jgi:hypothetical protein
VTMPMIPAGTSNERYCIVVAMNAPVPSPRMITASGKRQHSEASAAPTHATKPAVSAACLMVSPLRFFCGVRPVLERQMVRATAASNRVSWPHVVGECDDLIALGATGPMGEPRGPATGVFMNAQGVPRAARTLHQVPRPCPFGQLNACATVRAADYAHQRIPKSRCNRPRSKPTTTSSFTVMTGTARRPVRAINSSRAAVSSATFLAVKSKPWDERNSFAA